MKVIIIGSGNVATHLAHALYSAKVNIAQIWSYHTENASFLAAKVDAEVVTDLAQLDRDADLCIVAVKDDAIEGIANQLKGFKGCVVHTSGAVGMDVFSGSSKEHGVFYPLQTFSKTREVDFSTIPLCIEANTNEVLKKLKLLASNLSRNVLEINSEKRKILHLAAVFACNFPNHLYALADEILTAHQLGFDILRPLILETALKVQESLPITVQTGPAIRDDQETLKKTYAVVARAATTIRNI